MKSIAIFLILTFFAGFQAAVISEEPPAPLNSETSPSFLENVQEQLGKVNEKFHEGLEAVKGRFTELWASATEMGKKMNANKLMNRKFSNILQSIHNQGKEVMNDQYMKAKDMVEEIKTNPTVAMVQEELLGPVVKKCSQWGTWLGEQTLTSVYNTVSKLPNKVMSYGSESMGAGHGKKSG